MAKQPKRRLVYEGPRGSCPCCHRLTQIRVGSTHGLSEEVSWEVPVSLIEHVYREVHRRVKIKTVAGKSCRYVTDPNPHNPTVRLKYFFVGSADDEVAGPFGFDGLKVFLEASLGGTGYQSVRVYIVSTTTRALAIICDSPFVRDAENRPPEPDPEADLF